MKKYMLVTLGVVALLVIGGLTGCSGNGVPGQFPSAIDVNVRNPQQGISVNGLGKVTVTPDIASLNLGISAQALTVADAQSQAATAMDKVMTALTSNGVAKKDIQTRVFNVEQVTRFDNGKQQSVVIGYRVTNTVDAKIRAIDKTGVIIDAVAVAGGDLTRINGLNFSVDDPSASIVSAREMAMKDAAARANQMAKLAGVELGKPISISENSFSPPSPGPVFFRSDAAGGSAAPTTQISAGQLDITVSVQVDYAIR